MGIAMSGRVCAGIRASTAEVLRIRFSTSLIRVARIARGLSRNDRGGGRAVGGSIPNRIRFPGRQADLPRRGALRAQSPTEPRSKWRWRSPRRRRACRPRGGDRRAAGPGLGGGEPRAIRALPHRPVLHSGSRTTRRRRRQARSRCASRRRRRSAPAGTARPRAACARWRCWLIGRCEEPSMSAAAPASSPSRRRSWGAARCWRATSTLGRSPSPALTRG